MLKSNDVYVHRRADTGDVFYVGIGTTGRATSRSGRTAHWRNIVAKHGLRIEYVARGVTRAEAIEAEVFLIKWLGRKADGSGPLVNITDGGEGCPGRDRGKKLSDEHRAKLAAAKIGSKQSSETVERRVSKVRGQKRTAAQKAVFSEIARNRSPDHIAKISKALTGKKVSDIHLAAIRSAISVPVRIVGGRAFDAVADAVSWLRLDGFPAAAPGNISACCKGKRPMAYGHRWAYVDK